MDLGREFEKYAVKHVGIGSHNVDQYSKLMSKPSNMTPYILEERELNVTQMDVFSRLLRDRIIFLNQEVNDQSMSLMIAQIMFLDSVDNSDIKLMCLTPGGSVHSGGALVTLIRKAGTSDGIIKSEVETTVVGYAASMGAVITSSGTKGKRNIMKNSRFMIHDISGGASGDFETMRRNLELSRELREELFEILADNSGNSVDQIREWCDRDYWMKGDEAIKLGFLDNVIGV